MKRAFACLGGMLWVLIVFSTATSQAPQQDEIVAVPEPVEEKITDDDWKKFVIGQKVIFIKTDPKQDELGFHRYGKSVKSRKEAELITGYIGKTGVILDLITEKKDMWSWEAYVIALDGSTEKVVARTHHLGFLTEMEIVRTYIGKAAWSGGVNLVKDLIADMQPDQIKANSFFVKDGERLVITRAEWGDDSSQIYLCFKSAQGQEGCLKGSGRISDKFRRGGNYYLRDFYFEDPLKWLAAEPTQTAEQRIGNLARLKGEWDMTASYSHGGLALSGKNVTFSFGSTTSTGKKVIEQPAPETIKFSFGGSPEYHFTLKLDSTSPRYILSAKAGDEPLIADVVLVYRDKEGFVKGGPSKGGKTGFSPKISVDETGAHTWLIKPDFKITFTKLKEGESKSPSRLGDLR